MKQLKNAVTRIACAIGLAALVSSASGQIATYHVGGKESVGVVSGTCFTSYAGLAKMTNPPATSFYIPTPTGATTLTITNTTPLTNDFAITALKKGSVTYTCTTNRSVTIPVSAGSSYQVMIVDKGPANTNNTLTSDLIYN